MNQPKFIANPASFFLVMHAAPKNFYRPQDVRKDSYGAIFVMPLRPLAFV
jgi:hypothetical protein